MTNTGEAIEPTSSSCRTISFKQLINLLNYANYETQSVTVNFTSLTDGSLLSLRATPEPCDSESVHLLWAVKPPLQDLVKAHSFANILIDKGSAVVVVSGKMENVDTSGITVLLSKNPYVMSKRHIERYKSKHVRAVLSQNGKEVDGLLSDFGGSFLRIRIAAVSPKLSRSNRLPIQISLNVDGRQVYEGKGEIKRELSQNEGREVVLALLAPPDSEFETSFGHELDPPLSATCRHPLTGKIVRFKITALSYRLFLAQENYTRATFFAGLVIPEMRIDFGAAEAACCTTKVIGGRTGSWLVMIMDMSVIDQRRIFSFLERRAGQTSEVGVAIDPEDIVRFFFEAGFIYPAKYSGLADIRAVLHNVFARLYLGTPSICQHFLCERDGVIEAHIAMLHLYQRSWLIHHHASLRVGAGSSVLGQISRYINNYSMLSSTMMDYLLFYFRPENRFPDRVFGGFCRSSNDRRVCSIDPLAYVHFDPKKVIKELDQCWALGPASAQDLSELTSFYASASGGLMLQALDLTPEDAGSRMLDDEYTGLGLKRQKLVLSLKNKGKTSAVIVALDSTPGLNMSGFARCIHVFAIDEATPYDVMMSQLSSLSSFYDQDEVPLLVFPCSYPAKHGVSPDKIYNLFVFRASVGERFFEFTNCLIDRTARRGGQVLS
jgi:hypothetical protein